MILRTRLLGWLSHTGMAMQEQRLGVGIGTEFTVVGDYRWS